MTEKSPSLWLAPIKRIILSILALALVCFLVVHLIGNLTILHGLKALDSYALFLDSLLGGFLKPLAEALLLLLFIGHAGLSLLVYQKNRTARPVPYQVNCSPTLIARSTTFSLNLRRRLSSLPINIILTRLMWASGIYLIVFILIHVAQLRFGLLLSVEGSSLTDSCRSLLTPMYTSPAPRMRLVFAHWSWILFYMLGIISLGLHLGHGVWSAFQSLGLIPDQLSLVAQVLGIIFAIAITLVFASLPLYVHIQYPL